MEYKEKYAMNFKRFKTMTEAQLLKIRNRIDQGSKALAYIKYHLRRVQNEGT